MPSARLYSFAEITEDFINSATVSRGYVAPCLCNRRLWIRIGPRVMERRGEIPTECGRRAEYLLIRGPHSGIAYRHEHHLEAIAAELGCVLKRLQRLRPQRVRSSIQKEPLVIGNIEHCGHIASTHGESLR
jgi:hypothetical protein